MAVPAIRIDLALDGEALDVGVSLESWRTHALGGVLLAAAGGGRRARVLHQAHVHAPVAGAHLVVVAVSVVHALHCKANKQNSQ